MARKKRRSPRGKKGSSFLQWIIGVLIILIAGVGVYYKISQTASSDNILAESLPPPLVTTWTPLGASSDWACEFDLAVQTAWPSTNQGVEIKPGGIDKSTGVIKRRVEINQQIPLSQLRSQVWQLVQEHRGRIFQTQGKKAENLQRWIFYLGGKGENVRSYILEFYQEPSPPPKLAPQKPVIILVIDDLGYNLSQAMALFSLDLPLTVSILPHHRFTRQLAEEAHQRACEVILHLPMQPLRWQASYLEKNTLLTTMSNDLILKIIDDNLKSIPWVVGVNNHMGSKMVEDERSMRTILEELKKRDLYFLDSRTTEKSVGYSLARELGVRTACRQVFLDNYKDLDYIEGQIDLLIDKALKEGKAIGIGHLHPHTIQALRMAIPKFKEQGINLTTLSEVVE